MWRNNQPEQQAACLFEVLPERFTFEDLLETAALTDLTEEALRAFLEDYQKREMVAARDGLYAKSGHRPYRTDQGMH